MCGIFAIYSFDKSRPVDLSVVKYATDEMKHRGPDDSGYYVNGNVGLGHRRLSIIDLTTGHQPMTNEDGQIITIYNGEIYNYHEIRKDLIDLGHIFCTHSDTEVIIHGYEEWGTQCVHKFNGMFAFALWDIKKKRLWIVRDRVGIKPIYYFYDDKYFLCASEIRSILKTRIIDAKINDNVLDAYFSLGYVPGHETMFKGIKKLLPGHFLLIEGTELSDHEYWDIKATQENSMDIDSSLEMIEKLLLDSVSKRLMSDVPLGVFLSGGLDSSTIVGMMNKLPLSEPINTFTISYSDGYNEEKYANLVAERYKTSHNVLYLESFEFFSSLKTLVHYSEEPIVEPAAIALYHISKMAKDKATVLLSGEGADEVFAGYFLYRFMCILNKIHAIVPRKSYPLFIYLNKYSSKDKYQKYMDWLISPLSERYQGTSSYLTESLKKQYYSDQFFKNKPPYIEDIFKGYFSRVQDLDPLSQMLYVDTKTWLVDDLLLKADKMTMATSVELRVPFLDYRIIEAVSGLPPRYKIRNGQGKYLLKRIVEQLLPHEIVYRKKMGFPLPTHDWFQREMVTQIQPIISRLKCTDLFNPRALDRLVSRHKDGVEDHSKFLMTLLVFSEWMEQYL